MALNLAEGSGKSSTKDRLRFYEIALGSVRECEAVMEIIGYEGPATQVLDQLARSVFCLCRAVRKGVEA